MALRWIVLVGFVALSCRDRDPAPAPAPPQSARPLVSPPKVSGSPSTSAPEPVAPAFDAGAPDGRAAPVGGNWLRCYASFAPRTDPELDVMRLGLLCGPSNGMRKLTDARESKLRDGGAAREHRFAAQAGDCYRIFAVGEPSVEDLDVEVFNPKGARIAWDTSDDRWPVVAPDGPFCVFSEGEHRAVVRAQRGAGRYAVEIWRLR